MSGFPKPETSVFTSEVSQTGPWYFTGGSFGPEGSVFAFLSCSMVGLYFVRRAMNEGKIYPSAWEVEEEEKDEESRPLL